MGKTLTISNVSTEVRLKMRLLCVARGITMAVLLAELVDREWMSDSTVASDELVRVARRLVKRAFKSKRSSC